VDCDYNSGFKGLSVHLVQYLKEAYHDNVWHFCMPFSMLGISLLQTDADDFERCVAMEMDSLLDNFINHFYER